jgi:hypothetical protein
VGLRAQVRPDAADIIRVLVTMIICTRLWVVGGTGCSKEGTRSHFGKERSPFRPKKQGVPAVAYWGDERPDLVNGGVGRSIGVGDGK